MRTDIPLKRLTRLCPADLLPLLGGAADIVMGVETLELPAGATRLDTILRLRSDTGQDYLHLIEWQGYDDPFLLWRLLGYLSWLGQNRVERPILATVVYVTPAADVGDTLTQTLNGLGWTVTLPTVRLWEQDAAVAVASGAPGLLTLSPLMQGADATLVETAARMLITEVAPPAQAELLAALGIFAEPLLDTVQFVRFVTKERLMTSDLITYLTEEKTAALEAEITTTQAQARESLQHALALLIRTRFPDAPIRLLDMVEQVTDLIALRQALDVVAHATDVATLEQALQDAAGDARV